jgi:hypothetical protein
MKNNNHWVTTGAAFLLMGSTFGGLGGCDNSVSTNSGIVSQPAGTPSPQASSTGKTNAPPPVVPPVTLETKSQQPSSSPKNPSKQNAPASPGASNQQPMTTQMPAPKIRVIPDASLSPQLIIERGGTTSTFNAQDFRSEVMDSMDCQKTEKVDRQTLTVTNFMRDQMSMNPRTGEIAIGVIFQYCALVQESAVVVLKSNSDGSYQPRMLQVPGKQALPSNNATYPLAYIKSLRYTNNNLLVIHGSAAGAEAELEFRDGAFASCRVTVAGEGEQKVCP